jgi:signal transduction histidine kinase
MKGNWAKPSLSRDFALLSVAIIFVLVLISGWVATVTYMRYSERVVADLAKEAERIDHTLSYEIDNSAYLLGAMGRQISYFPPDNLPPIAQLLKAFDAKTDVYTLFSWINANQQLVVSSSKGVLERPVDVSDRDYVKKALADPWKMQIGRPVEGRVSGRWIIPLAMGLTDVTGKHIGTLLISMDINELTSQISHVVNKQSFSFAIVSKTLILLTQVSEDENFVGTQFPLQKLSTVNITQDPRGILSTDTFYGMSNNYSYYSVSDQYPYIILLGYNKTASDRSIQGILWPRLLQIFIMAVFCLSFLWLIRLRIIKPVVELTNVAAGIARGDTKLSLLPGGPAEIDQLSQQFIRIGDYIDERRRIADELRNKTFLLKRAKERAELAGRSKSEFLAYLCHELRNPLNAIVGFAQVMKDQLYGPIENKKYRQYASDIYASGLGLLGTTQDLLTLLKADTEALHLQEKPVDVAAVLNKSLRYLGDQLQADKLNLRLTLPQRMPKMMADELRLQQVFTNVVLHCSRYAKSGDTLSVEVRTVEGERAQTAIALIVAAGGEQPVSSDDLQKLVEKTLPPGAIGLAAVPEISAEKDKGDLGLALVKILLDMYRASYEFRPLPGGGMQIIACFPADRSRLDLMDS